MLEIKQLRDYMKANFNAWDGAKSDQEMKLPQPSLIKPPEGGFMIELPDPKGIVTNEKNLFEIIVDRKSIRKYSDDSISLLELSYLLYTTQGVKHVDKNNRRTYRTVPSGGARHPFVTYLSIQKVDGIDKGVYRYHPLTHQLEFLFYDEDYVNKVTDATLGQSFVIKCPVTFIWSCIPYRGEWRYHVSAHKTMLLDAGHLCQNLYISSEGIDCGTCAIAAYDQKLIDEFLKLDGEDEFVVYLAPVGKKIKK